jgi:hypothetical protein
MNGKAAEKAALAAGSKAVSAPRASQSPTKLPHPPFFLAFLPSASSRWLPALSSSSSNHRTVLPLFIIIGETLLGSSISKYMVLYYLYYHTYHW